MLNDETREALASIFSHAHRELSERITLDEAGTILGVETGQFHADAGQWKIHLTVNTPHSELLLEPGDQLERLSDATEWGTELQEEVEQVLYETLDALDPDNTRVSFFGSSVGPQTVEFDEYIGLPEESILPEDETLYEVTVAEYKSTKVRVTDDEVDTDDAPEDVAIQKAERTAAMDSSTSDARQDVIGVRPVSPEDRETVPFEEQTPLSTSARARRRVQEGDMFRIGGQQVVAIQEPHFNTTLVDVESGDWVRRIDPNDFHRRATGLADWEFVGTADDSTVAALTDNES